MNAGILNEKIKLREPIWKSNDYDRVVHDDWVDHERWASVSRKHSKYFNFRFAGSDQEQGLILVRKDSTVEKCTHVEIDAVNYKISSMIPYTDTKYLEIVYSEDKE